MDMIVSPEGVLPFQSVFAKFPALRERMFKAVAAVWDKPVEYGCPTTTPAEEARKATSGEGPEPTIGSPWARTPVDLLADIAERFEGARKEGDGYMALCPAHPDTNPSLSIRRGGDGRVLVHCFAGCRAEDVLAAVGLSFRDLFPRKQGIVVTYDYRDESGSLLYQVCRLEPKAFRQRRPDGNGGWVSNVKGVRRVLYRLPDLLAADPAAPVFFPEGEKDADRVATLGLVATTTVGGAKAQWEPGYSEALRGRHVVLLPDNDEPGRERVRVAATVLVGVAASVKVLELPGLPEKGDVSDWLDAGGTAADLVALAEDTSLYDPADAPKGKPLGTDPSGQREPDASAEAEALSRGALGGGSPRPPFPIDAFPAPLAAHIRAVAAGLQCPPDFVGTFMLAVLAAVVGRKRRVEIRPGWVEIPVLWVVVVARSAEGKTPALKVMMVPLRTIQRRLLLQYRREKAEYRKLPPKERGEEPPPRLEQAFTTDATVEALKDILDASPTGTLYVADELAGWLRGMDQYKGGKGNDRQFWLSVWSSTDVIVNRKTADEPVMLPEPAVGIVGGIQPGVLADLVGDGREDGLEARFLIAYPAPLPPPKWSETGIPAPGEFGRVCEALWELPWAAAPVPFSAAAKEVWAAWYDAHMGAPPPDWLRPVWGKAPAHVARMALVLHLARVVCGEAGAGAIDATSVSGAVALMDYFLAHARRVHRRAVEASDKISRVLQWVQKYGRVVTARKARMHGLCKSTDEAVELFHYLAELGHGTVVERPRGSTEFHLLQTPGNPPDVQEGRP